MGNVSYRTGCRKLYFDAASERFRDDEANRFLKPAYRRNYRIPDAV
jgi:hypothetical protein